METSNMFFSELWFCIYKPIKKCGRGNYWIFFLHLAEKMPRMPLGPVNASGKVRVIGYVRLGKVSQVPLNFTSGKYLFSSFIYDIKYRQIVWMSSS